MASHRLAELAVADLQGIFAYPIENFVIERAERYKNNLVLCIEGVAADPRLGRPVVGRTRVFYRYNCQKHIVYFSKETDGLLVVRVLHRAMEFKRHLPK